MRGLPYLGAGEVYCDRSADIAAEESHAQRQRQTSRAIVPRVGGPALRIVSRVVGIYLEVWQNTRMSGAAIFRIVDAR